MDTAEIRESFLAFFESKGCRRMPSSSLIPEDPSLLLTTAGMVQFKPVFLGNRDMGTTRVATCQKCVRTTDIDIIGTTGRHQSFFEMLGNFSFGDYFKSEACAWAYEYSTQVLGLDPERMYYTVFEEDDEAERIWVDEVGVPAERVYRMGEKDNFWSAGPTGPCGPCSELYYDQGEEAGCGSPDCAPGCDCDRYVEYWNLVFMQFDRQEDGSLVPLPKRNIDTGMGLERLAAILQGVTSNYETDLLRQLMSVAEDVSGVAYGAAEGSDTSLRIVTDHCRAVVFMIADGILTSNEGRGYVLRRLLRRAIRHGRLLGVEDPFLVRMVDEVITLMGGAYPEVVEHAELIRRIVASEEERFGATLRQGTAFLSEALERLKADGADVLDGTAAFTLHDTYGFPFELTCEMAAEAGVSVDADGFEAQMEAQRQRGRSHVQDVSWSASDGVWDDLVRESGATDFVGYESDAGGATVLAVLVDGERVTEVSAPVSAEIVLDSTPFYAEQGGQVGDEGVIVADGVRFEVADTKLRGQGVHSHVGQVAEGVLRVGDRVRASIDVMRRERIRRNHTATHLLHWALRLVLGEHAKQAGSAVGPDRFRFDFTHFEAMSDEQVAKVERLVNAKIFENHPVRAYETSLDSARDSGVTALFGEKYGDYVRVLEIGNFSKELCGGTHAARTSEIGLLRVVSEGSVGANLRRIEGVTSFDAYELVRADEVELAEAAAVMRVPTRDVAEKAASLIGRIKELESGADRVKEAVSEDVAGGLLEAAADVGYRLVVGRLAEARPGGFRSYWDVLKARGADAVVLAAQDAENGKALLLAAGTDAAVSAGFDAGAVVREMAPLVNGRGGGKAAMAQGGGEDASGIDVALDAARGMLGAS